MQIEAVRISGFRGIKNLEIDMAGCTVIIGENNTGKTSVMKAIQTALGDYSRYISEEDFYLEKKIKSKAIIIDIKFGFSDEALNQWIEILPTDATQLEGDNTLLAIRTVMKVKEDKVGFDTCRVYLKQWKNFDDWEKDETKSDIGRETKASLKNILIFSIDSQRDIVSDIKNKYSFAGKILSNLEYKDEAIEGLSNQIQAINKDARDNSIILQEWQEDLNKLSNSLGSDGVVEITPFPKEIRDLSKYFSIHFGKEDNTFSMEYHGMGTRSWASILSAQTLAKTLMKTYISNKEPLFTLILAEEPEAHLHPNSQRTVYSQLHDDQCQTIISTHSPYIASCVDLKNIVCLRNNNNQVTCSPVVDLDEQSRRKITQQIIRTKGELLFAKALILFEGITEEQIIPSLFQVYFKKTTYEAGITCVGVDGYKSYKPFLKTAKWLQIPTYILSDNDKPNGTDIKKNVEKQFDDYKNDDKFYLEFLVDGNAFEEEILKPLNNELRQCLIDMESCNENYREQKKKEVKQLTDQEILTKVKNSKTSYSYKLADIIVNNYMDKNKEEVEKILPDSIKNLFNKILKNDV